MKPRNTQTGAGKPKSDWVKSPVANLVRYKPSGIYFARVRVRGKLFRESLKTNVVSVAKLRLADFVKNRRDEMGDDSAIINGKLTMADTVTILRQELKLNTKIKEGAKVYRLKCLGALLKTWPELPTKSVAKVSKQECKDWAAKIAAMKPGRDGVWREPGYSPSVYNNTVGTLRMLFDIAVERGARAQNPAGSIGKKTIIQRELSLPSPEQFEQFVSRIEKAGGGCSRQCGELVRFLAYGGFRITEACNILFSDCEADQIRVRVTKNGEARTVPMIEEMRGLIEQIRTRRTEARPEDPVMEVNECQKAMDSAAKKVGMTRITHHDLRHLFATRCIESGVDIPTVSRWLGHKDGGALAMKVYGHLRDHHSVEMAKKVSFSNAKAN